MSEWKSFCLGDVVTFQRGYDLPKRKMIDGVYPVIGSNGIIGWHNQFTTENPSITVGRSGNVGQPFIYYGKSWSHNTTLFIKEFKNVHPQFIYYLLKTLNLNHYAGGTTVPTLNRNHIKNLSINLPPLETQKKIAAVLSALDDKIELNNAINKNLEEQAQAIFKSWFIDFEPFGGTMPDDWKEIYLSDIATFIGGYSYKGKELKNSSTAMITIKNFNRNGGFKMDGLKEIIPSAKVKAEHYVEIFDVFVAHTDLTQNAEIIGRAENILSLYGYEKMIFSMDVVKVIPKTNEVSRFLLSEILRTKKFKVHCMEYVNGTTVLHLSKKALPEYKLFFPTDFSQLTTINKIFSTIYERLSNNESENQKLGELRDVLLPRLMSGEIDVSAVEI